MTRMNLVALLAGGLALGIAWWRVYAGDNPATQPSAKLEDATMKTEQATFAAGCFWGVEATFRKVPGVLGTQVGYTAGQTADPTYKQVCTDRTGHAEAVLVTFDPTKVSFPELLDAFWSLHDPTTINRQGPDVGTQYRSGIYFHSPEQEQQARASLEEVQSAKIFRGKIVTEILPASRFYSAEEYHQQYFEKQGMAATCHVGVAEVHTKLAAEAAAKRKAMASCDPNDPNAACGTEHWKSMSDEELKKKLTPEQYEIARHAGTERAFTGKYWDEHRAGTYRCAVCGLDLFDSNTKFDSGTGWPSFFMPISKDAVVEHTDSSLGIERTEVLCARCQSHLGHVFNDGPEPTGKRYCMNSAVLDLKVSEKPATAPAK